MATPEQIGNRPAFPFYPDAEGVQGGSMLGMTMWQWYKGQAVAGLSGLDTEGLAEMAETIGKEPCALVAEAAAKLADALLAEDAAKENERGDK